MKKKVLVVLADGFEEIEAVTPIDILRRAGMDVMIAGVAKTEVTSARGLKVVVDVPLEKYKDDPDVLILPGGGLGAANLKNSETLKTLILKMNHDKRLIAAICASPAVVLAPLGVLQGKKATCFPGCEKDFGADTLFLKDRVVKDEHIITSQGPGTAAEFSLEIVKVLLGEDQMHKLADQMLLQIYSA